LRPKARFLDYFSNKYIIVNIVILLVLLETMEFIMSKRIFLMVVLAMFTGGCCVAMQSERPEQQLQVEKSAKCAECGVVLCDPCCDVSCGDDFSCDITCCEETWCDKCCKAEGVMSEEEYQQWYKEMSEKIDAAQGTLNGIEKGADELRQTNARRIKSTEDYHNNMLGLSEQKRKIDEKYYEEMIDLCKERKCSHERSIELYRKSLAELEEREKRREELLAELGLDDEENEDQGQGQEQEQNEDGEWVLVPAVVDVAQREEVAGPKRYIFHQQLNDMCMVAPMLNLQLLEQLEENNYDVTSLPAHTRREWFVLNQRALRAWHEAFARIGNEKNTWEWRKLDRPNTRPDRYGHLINYLDDAIQNAPILPHYYTRGGSLALKGPKGLMSLFLMPYALIDYKALLKTKVRLWGPISHSLSSEAPWLGLKVPLVRNGGQYELHSYNADENRFEVLDLDQRDQGIKPLLDSMNVKKEKVKNISTLYRGEWANQAVRNEDKAAYADLVGILNERIGRRAQEASLGLTGLVFGWGLVKGISFKSMLVLSGHPVENP